ncbi:orotate phosphoribosyltransferase [Sphingobium nicotianae]|uniref:Orotate phosphoribosyltransferase n=1 Tax=Sphingobium nicotianae TaxID=2782607 RepID=A0A9X1DEX5_9SPHN|nr:orotate phosphoribosyltransferase [Sphingobium nicotianae]MBT2188662.1 orotate phosphoribosyltransferase [Sphingobium nicotianae]
MSTDPTLARDLAAAATLRGSFLLRSGTIADTYFDKYRFEGDPALLRRLADAMLALVPAETQLLAGLELGGVPIATAMSLASGLPAVFVRKQAKSYGTCLAVEGGDVTGKRVLLVEDVISTGGAIADAVPLVRAAGAQIIGVVCAIWRGDGAPGITVMPDLPVRAAFTRAVRRS